MDPWTTCGRFEGAVEIPVFRKDFVIHRVQLLEARAAGADGVLLIARILSDEELGDPPRRGSGPGPHSLVEVHGRRRWRGPWKPVPGSSGSTTETFRPSQRPSTSPWISCPYSSDVVVVSESGIRTSGEVDRLGAAGVQGILVGETLLRAEDPVVAAGELSGCPRVPRDVARTSPSGGRLCPWSGMVFR